MDVLIIGTLAAVVGVALVLAIGVLFLRSRIAPVEVTNPPHDSDEQDANG